MKKDINVLGSTPKNVISQNIVGVSQEILGKIPNIESLKRSLRNNRNSKFTEPKSIHFKIPEAFQDVVIHDELFPDDTRIICIGDPEVFGNLQDVVTIFGDGTFDKTPKMFLQLYSWHTKIGEKHIPFIHFLLDYSRMFEIMKKFIPNLNPQRILLDLEMSALLAARSAYNHACLNVCFFHFSQSILRKINGVGLKKTYEANKEERVKLKSLMALAFVPELEVDIVYKELVQTFPQETAYVQLADYFEQTYLDYNFTTAARFPLDLWNHHQSVVLSNLKLKSAF